MNHPAPFPSPRAPVKYKKPGSLNVVSLALLAFLLAAGYTAAMFWPALQVHGRAKGALQDTLVQLYQLNLKPEPHATREAIALRKQTFDLLRQTGLKDPELQVKFSRNKQLVSIEASYRLWVELRGLNKRISLSFNPKVQTDAARVEWE